jgi:1-acyl-sn-glycerol-3-phosphate acyltransferase
VIDLLSSLLSGAPGGRPSRTRILRIPPFHWWRTVFWLIPTIGVYTIVLGTLSVGSVLLGGRGKFAHGCARTWAWLILATTGVNVTVAGLERIDRRKGYLFLSNHQSFYDIPVIFWYLPWDLRIIAKESLGSFPFIGWHLRRTGHVLVRRDNPGAAVFQQLSDMMKAGRSLIVFPEGTRSADGRVGVFRSGIFRLAIEAGLEIVPVAVRGSRHVMRKNRLMTCPGQVTLQVFESIPTTGLTGDAARDLAQRVRTIVAEAVAGDEDRAPSGNVGPS